MISSFWPDDLSGDLVNLVLRTGRVDLCLVARADNDSDGLKQLLECLLLLRSQVGDNHFDLRRPSLGEVLDCLGKLGELVLLLQRHLDGVEHNG